MDQQPQQTYYYYYPQQQGLGVIHGGSSRYFERALPSASLMVVVVGGEGSIRSSLQRPASTASEDHVASLYDCSVPTGLSLENFDEKKKNSTLDSQQVETKEEEEGSFAPRSLTLQ